MAEPIDPVELPADGLLLRPWRSSDAGAVHRICQDPLIQRWTTVPSPYSRADAQEWVGSRPAQWARGRVAAWAVTDARSGTVLASVSLGGLDQSYPEIGFWCAADARGRGVVTRAGRAACRWAFARGAPKVLWLANVGNEASWRSAHAMGFAFEGRRVAELPLRDGTRGDAWAAALLPSALNRDPAPWPFDPLPRLVAGPVSLRRWTADDIPRLVRLRNEPGITGWGTSRVADDPAQAWEDTTVGHVEDWLLGRAARLAVCVEGEPVGNVTLRLPAGPGGGHGVLGWWLGEAARGQGVGTRAVRLVVDWAFDSLGLRRLAAGVHVDNAPSQALAERVGLRREGLGRGQAPAYGGGFGDGIAYGLLADDRR